MKGFIEVHCNKLPMLINIDRISGVQDNVYARNRHECSICLNDSILCNDEPDDFINPDESYDEVKRKIEEATK